MEMKGCQRSRKQLFTNIPQLQRRGFKLSGKVTPIGTLSGERLREIPEHYQAHHEFCFYVHDIMADLLRETESVKADRVQLQFGSAKEARAFERLRKESDVVTALEIIGYGDQARRVVMNRLYIALYGDFLHFVHEALKALEKRKFTVGLALLRKPLKENLFLATWACAEEEGFYTALSEGPDEKMDAQRIQPQRRKCLFDACIQKLSNKSMLDSDLLFSILYDRNMISGMANYFDKANHLVTGSRPMLKTEKMNLNFIFKNPYDNDVYETIYLRIAYLLIFSFSVQVELFSRMQKIGDLYKNYCLLSAVGSYEALFTSGRPQTAKYLLRTIRQFLKCPHCRAVLKLKKADMPRFLMAERVSCRVCGQGSHFPLFWLLAQSGIALGNE